MLFSRREWLQRSSNGFGALALSSLLAAESRADSKQPGLHHPAKAKSIIFLYMDGGPSQVDTFDYKPKLEKFNGQDPHTVLEKVEPTQFANVGKVMTHRSLVREVWGPSHADSTHYVRIQMGHLRRKLAETPRYPRGAPDLLISSNSVQRTIIQSSSRWDCAMRCRCVSTSVYGRA